MSGAWKGQSFVFFKERSLGPVICCAALEA
jgi:hypothetical protein